LEMLLAGDGWRLGGRYEDVHEFLGSIRLDQFRAVAEARKRIASRIKQLQPTASNRAIGATLGVSKDTVRRDLGANAPGAASAANTSDFTAGANAPQSGEAAARAAHRAANKDNARRAKKARRDQREGDLALRIRAASDALDGSKLYGVIYADPPWRWEPYSRESGMDRAADNHYPTMTLDEIMGLNVPAADDCILFLWATIPMLLEAFDVMAAWGFDYKSQFVWVKDKIGPGYWVRARHELLLIGTKGDIPCPVPGDQFGSVIEAPRAEHSRKPFAVYEMIEEMFPMLPRLEMFSRGGGSSEYPPGWDVWGAEAPSEEAA